MKSLQRYEFYLKILYFCIIVFKDSRSSCRPIKMNIFVDIHTHGKSEFNPYSVRSLQIKEAALFFDAEERRFCSVGIHPWNAEQDNLEDLERLFRYCSDTRWIAIGECGLDKNISTPFATQKSIFEGQISYSESLKKPLIIHCVGYFNELLEIRNKFRPEQLWIVHGFRGKPELAKQLLKTGISLSFGEKRNAASVAVTPIDRLYVETDESLLPVEQFYREIAEIKNCRPENLNAGKKLLHLKNI
jgi:TatD DNase family protein